MILNLNQYSTLIFDCDGVILNSNIVKTEAFKQLTLPYGEEESNAMLRFHLANGGVSRYKKLSHFIDSILPAYSKVNEGEYTLKKMLEEYSALVKQGLLNCEVAPGLDCLRKATTNTRWLIVSGSDQKELRDIFFQRGLSEWFDGGIFGSPDTKDEILFREITRGNIKKSAIYFGDSKYDFECAQRAGLDFIFVYGWTELKAWQSFTSNEGLSSIANLADALG